ncbi:MAG: hypothetical protein ACXWF5_07055 [Actinomycetota bacterium]
MSADRLRGLDDEALAGAIRAAGGDLRWPATPDLEPSVRRVVTGSRPRTGVGPVWPALPRRRRLVVLLAVALVLLGTAALAAKLVIDLGAVTVTTIPGRPTALPTDAVTGDDLGRPVSLEEAERLTGIRARYPAALGPPDTVWTEQGQVGFDELDTAPWIAMAWDEGSDLPPIGDAGRGAVLIQFRGEADVAAKVLYEEAGSIRRVRIVGGGAYWITGPHEFRLPVDGKLRAFHVDGSILLWQSGDDTFRLETALPAAGAIAIADTTGD